MGLFSKKKDTLLCIDIGFKNIKVVEVEVIKKEEINILNYAIIQTPRESIRNGHIRDIVKMSATIRKVLNDNKMNTKKTRVVLSGTHISSRLLMVRKPQNVQTDKLYRELAVRYLPTVRSETHEIDYRVFESSVQETCEVTKLFLYAVPKNIVKSYINMLADLGLIPESVEIPAFSMESFFKNEIYYVGGVPDGIGSINQPGEDIFSVVDFGSELTNLSIFRNKKLEFNKAIFKGSSSIDERLARRMYRRLDEAEALKINYGLQPPEHFSFSDRNGIIEGIKAELAETILQIKRFLDFYREKLNGEKVNRIYIVGGGSRLKGLREMLSDALQVPVYPVGLKSIRNIQVNPDLDRDKIDFLVSAVGMALN